MDPQTGMRGREEEKISKICWHFLPREQAIILHSVLWVDHLNYYYQHNFLSKWSHEELVVNRPDVQVLLGFSRTQRAQQQFFLKFRSSNKFVYISNIK